MSRSPMRRVAAVAAAGALVLGGATVSLGLGTGVAAAQESCAQSSHAEKGPNASTWGVKHIYDRSVNVTEAAPGQLVTYTTVISTTGIGNPYVNTVTEYPPAGFGAPVSAIVNAGTLVADPFDSDVTGTPNNGGWKFTNFGWFVNSSKPMKLITTYKVPDNAKPGTTITSGGVGIAGTVGVDNELPNLTACFNVRIPNVGETVLSVADETGLGSAEGQLSSTGSVSDILSDAIIDVINSGAIEGMIS